jgi:putative hydrolase of the HAD superfamily
MAARPDVPRRTLMLDVDGVLVNGRPGDGQHFATGLEADLGLSAERLQKAFFHRHWEAIVTGKEPMTERLTAVLAEIAPQLSAETLIAYWFENDSRIDEDVLAGAAALRADGWRIFLATNQEHLRVRYLMETLGLAVHVDGIVYSAALGHKKPAHEFFRGAESAIAAAPHDLVLVDDALANVEAARRCGWRAIHWTNQGRLPDLLAPYA